MRNQNDDNSISSWTVPSTVGTESFTQVSAAAGGLDGVKMLDLSVLPRHDSVGRHCGETTAFICATVTAADVEEEKRAPVAIVVALDVSSSMRGTKISDCKETLKEMVRNLTCRDYFGLICYSTHAKVEFPAGPMTPMNKEMVLEKIKHIGAYGNTNISGGLALAAQEMNMIPSLNAIRSIFLLTDGNANMGITDTEGLRAMVRDFASSWASIQTDAMQGKVDGISLDDETADTVSVNTKPSFIAMNKEIRPISLFCFGYGPDHNSEMLTAIARETQGGAYYFVEQSSDSNVSAAIGEAVGGVLSVVAQSAVITISLPPLASEQGIRILQVHHEQAIQRKEGFYTVNINDFYAQESRDVLFEVKLADSASSSTPLPHAVVGLEYFDAINGKNCIMGSIACRIARPENDVLSPINKHVEEQWLRIKTLQEIKAAKEEADANNFCGARERMNKTMRSMKANVHVDEKYRSCMLSDLEDVSRVLESKQTYIKIGHHKMANKMMQHSAQRSMASINADPLELSRLEASDQFYSKKKHRQEIYSTPKRAQNRARFQLQSKDQKK